MRTPEEIVARIESLKGRDFFGFQTGDLLEFLPFEQAKDYLKDEITAEQWTERKRDRDSVLQVIKQYMSFAWGKANDCRGLSASRSLDHMKAWLWMAGEDAFLVRTHNLENYTHYGKPQLRAICEHFDWDWRQWDDDEWRNSEGGWPEIADRVAAI